MNASYNKNKNIFTFFSIFLYINIPLKIINVYNINEGDNIWQIKIQLVKELKKGD